MGSKTDLFVTFDKYFIGGGSLGMMPLGLSGVINIFGIISLGV